MSSDCQENKLQRLSAYRQLQALSHQIHLATRGGFNLDSFKVPESICIAPVRTGETRFTCVDHRAGKIRAGIRDRNLEDKFLLPDSTTRWWNDVNLLVLQLDQGKIGSAGAASRS